MMKYQGYAGVVELDEGLGVFFGRVIGLRDVITFQGSSVTEVVQAFHDSVDDYLEFCAERGESPEKPYSGQFVLRVDPQLHGAMAREAEARSTSLNALIEDTLERTFGTPEPIDQAGRANTFGPQPPMRRIGQSHRTTVHKTAASKPRKLKGPEVPKSNKTVKK